MYNSKKIVKKAKAGSIQVAPAASPAGTHVLVERQHGLIASTIGGVVGNGLSVQPSVLILAARLAGFQAIYDQIKIESVTLTLKPYLGMSAAGLCVTYIERDSTDARVATPELAADQFESVRGRAGDSLRIVWKPQQPADFVFNELNPGTVSLAAFQIVGTGFPAVVQSVYQYELVSVLRFRGRP